MASEKVNAQHGAIQRKAMEGAISAKVDLDLAVRSVKAGRIQVSSYSVRIGRIAVPAVPKHNRIGSISGDKHVSATRSNQALDITGEDGRIRSLGLGVGTGDAGSSGERRVVQSCVVHVGAESQVICASALHERGSLRTLSAKSSKSASRQCKQAGRKD